MDIRAFGTTQSGAVSDKPANIARQAGPGAATALTPAHTAESKAAFSAPGEEQVAQALKSINDVLQMRSPGLEFTVDSESDRTIVKVVDTKTQEVIRQMPSEEAIQIAKALDQLQSLLVRQSA